MSDASAQASEREGSEADTLFDPDTQTARSQRLAPGDVVGRYEIVERLGAGAMGAVFSARDPLLDRMVALKVLHPSNRSANASQRLLREARTLAKVSHPNVVTVIDVGTDGACLYMAMELVHGQTLSAWLKAGPRPWPRVLAVMEQAGLGLAAVHEAGIVHRDFKPDNIMLSDDGRVQIADFGIAHLDIEVAPVERTPSVPGSAWSSTLDVLNSASGSSSGEGLRLTRTGALMGTPRYMAPEQFMATPTDGRTDQFAFCLVLWEALYGVPAFGGGSFSERALAVTMGRLQAPPPGHPVPSAIHRVLERGLSRRPDDRFASVPALLDALHRGPAAHRRKRGALLAGAGATVAGGLVIAAAVFAPGAGAACDGEARIASVWGTSRAEIVRGALGSTALPLGTASRERVVDQLDGYRDRWVDAYEQACEAGTGPVALEADDGARLDARIACLHERRRAMASLLEVLSRADETVVRNAGTAVMGLPDPGTCLDASAHAVADSTLPADPAQGAAVERVQAMIDEAGALDAAGLFDDAWAQLLAAHELAEPTEHAPLLAALWLARGRVADHRGAPHEAIDAYERAVDQGVAHGLDRTVVQAASALALQYASVHADFEAAHRWARRAEVALDRLEQDLPLEAARLDALASVVMLEGDLVHSQQLHEQALALRLRHFGERSLPVADSHQSLGRIALRRGDHDAAISHHEIAHRILEASLGSIHPAVVGALADIQEAHRSRGDFARAHEYDAIVLPALEAALGPEHPDFAATLIRRGALLGMEGYHEDSLRYLDRGLEIFERTHGSEHPSVAMVLSTRGVVLSAMGRHDEAVRTQRRVLRVAEATLPAGHADIAVALDNLGNALVEAGRAEEALPLHERALPIWEQVAPESTSVAISSTDHGLALLATDQAAEAVPQLQRAVELFSGGDVDPIELARARFALARAVRASSAGLRRATAREQARAEARALAEQARAAYVLDAVRGPAKIQEIDAWLAADAVAP